MKTFAFPHTLLLVALAAAATGCATSKIGVPYSEPGPGLDHPYRVSQKEEVLRIALVVRPGNEDSDTFAAGVRQTAITALRERKYNLVEDGTDDIGLDVVATETVWNDAAGRYFTLDGSVKSTLTDSISHDTLAQGTVSGRTEPVNERARASVALSGKVAPAYAEWLAEYVVPEQIPLSAVSLQIYNIDRFEGAESGFARAFVDLVSSMDGVLRCETESLDPVAHTGTFRVFYRRRSFPEGILPAIVLRDPKFKFVL